MSRPVELFSTTVGRSPSSSTVGGALFAGCLIIGGLLSGLLGHPAPLVAGGIVGVYFLFAIRVADQWEKVAVLRLGRYRGLRGPGLVPRHPDRRHGQRVRGPAHPRDERARRNGADARHGPRERGRDRLLGGLERREGDSRGGELRGGHRAQRADRAAGVDRPPRAGADDHRPRDARARAAADPRREDEPVGHHGPVGRDPRRPRFRRNWRTRCRGRAQAERERQARIILGTAETEISDKFAAGRAASTATTRSPCTCAR